MILSRLTSYIVICKAILSNFMELTFVWNILLHTSIQAALIC